MRQFKLSILSSIAVVVLLVGVFTACKKDAFSEKDAIAAQTTLLSQKFSFDLAIKTMDLQIQRSGDSAKIVIQGLVNSGATALEILKQTNMLAQILANQNNLLAQLRYSDSLANNTAALTEKLFKVRQLWLDSVTLATTNTATAAAVALALKKNYVLSFIDATTTQPIAGLVVSVLPLGSSTFLNATTNAQGTATFTGITVDPASYFTVTGTNYGLAAIREANMTTPTPAVTGGVTTKYNGTATTLYNSGNLRNTVNGSVMGDLNLTNGDAVEPVIGQLITFTELVTLNGATVLYTFAAMSDANGSFTANLPDAIAGSPFTVSYPSTIRVQQKMFVNAWADEDGTTVTPRIDSTGVTLATSTAVANLTAGAAYGIYLKYPNDVNGKIVVAPFASGGNNFQNNVYIPTNYNTVTTTQLPFINRNTAGARTDSATGNGNNAFYNVSTFFNNSPTGTQQSLEPVRYRVRANTAAQPLDTLSVSLISLVPGWMTSPIQLATINSAAGRPGAGVTPGIFLARTDNNAFIQVSAPVGNPTAPLGPTNYPATGSILGTNHIANPSFGVKAGAGGIFNHAVMYTARGNAVYGNFYGGTVAGTFATYNTAGMVLTAVNAASIQVTAGQTYYLPIEYARTIARDRTPR